MGSRSSPGNRVTKKFTKPLLGGLSSSPGVVDESVHNSHERVGTVLDEVKEVITLPEFNARAANKSGDYEFLELPEAVSRQLHEYVRSIAGLYRNNPFHNFEHASHVTMSVIKLLSRIVAPRTSNTKWIRIRRLLRF